MKNFKYLPWIVQYMEDADCHWQQNVETNSSQLKSDILAEYVYYPSSFESDNPKENKEILKNLKLKNVYEPYEKTFLEPSNIALLSDENKKQNEEYSLILVSFEIAPIPELKGKLRMQILYFYLIPSYYEDGTVKISVFYNPFPYINPIENITRAKILTEDTQDEKEKFYLKVFTNAVEIICNQFKIITEQNQGKFVENVKEDPEKLLEDFIEITQAKDYNDENDILKFKENLKLIQEKPEEYKEILVDEGYFDEDAEIDIHYFTQYLLSEFLCAYDTDWKIDHEELSEFIAAEIGQGFKITFEETLQKPSVISEKIEAASEFTLLNIDTQMDSYSFFICKKLDKDKILALAKKLAFPIENY